MFFAHGGMFKCIVFSMTQMYDIFHYFLLDGLRIYCVARTCYFPQVQVTCQVEPMSANAFMAPTIPVLKRNSALGVSRHHPITQHYQSIVFCVHGGMIKFNVFSMIQMYDIFHYFLLDRLRIYCVTPIAGRVAIPVCRPAIILIPFARLRYLGELCPDVTNFNKKYG